MEFITEKVVEKGMEDKGIREERVIYKEKEKELSKKDIWREKKD